jgi:hypothetical protein
MSLPLRKDTWDVSGRARPIRGVAMFAGRFPFAIDTHSAVGNHPRIPVSEQDTGSLI